MKEIDMRRNSLKDIIISRYFLFIAYFFTFLTSCYLGNLGKISQIVDGISISIFFIIILCYLVEKRVSKIFFAIILFIIMGALSTFNGEYSSIDYFFKIFYRIISIALLTDMSMKYDSEKTINILYVVFYILCILNLVSILKYPHGMYISDTQYSNWFFTYDNLHCMILFPAVIVGYLRNYFINKKINISFIILLIIVSYQVYYCFSATTVFCYTLILIYLLISEILKKNVNVEPNKYLIAFYILFILIVLFRVQNIFNWLIVDVLKKDLTFTGRVYVWDKAIEYIKLHPFLGYGYETTSVISRKLGSPLFTHCHNTILDVMYKGGVFSLGIFLYLLYLPFSELNKIKSNKIANFLAFSIFIFLIMFIFESREDKMGLFLVLVIAFNIKYIIEKNSSKMKGKQL